MSRLNPHWINKDKVETTTATFENATSAFHGILDRMVDGTWTPNHYGGPRSNFHDMVFTIKNPDQNPINLIEAGFRVPNRWTKFLQDYCVPELYRAFFFMLWSSQSGQSIQYTIDNRSGHSLGPCVVGLNFLGAKPHRMQMTNRTAQISPIASLDISFLCESARIASEILQLDRCMPATWYCNSIQCHVVEAGHIYAYRGMLDWVKDLADREVSWTSREIMKHVGYALEHKETAWRTFERAWKKTRERRELHKTGQLHTLGKPYYAVVPTSYWNPFKEGHTNAEELEAKYGINRKWVRYRVRPFRAMLKHRWGWNTPNCYDLVWEDNHPERLVIDQVYHHGGSVESINDLCKALNLETEEEAKDYCWPYYEVYNDIQS